MANNVADLISVINDHYYCGFLAEWSKEPLAEQIHLQLGTLQPEDKCLDSILLPKPPQIDDLSDQNNNIDVITSQTVKTCRAKSILKMAPKRVEDASLSKEVRFQILDSTTSRQSVVISGACLNSKRKRRSKSTKKPTPVKCCKKSSHNLPQSTALDVYTRNAMDKIAREAYSSVIDCSREEAEAKIIETEIRMKILHAAESCDPQHEVPKTPEFRLDSDDITRIKELFPPDNYEPPTSEKRDLQCIRRFSADNLLPDVNTLRCISNYGVHVDVDTLSCYQTDGNYYSSDVVNCLPEPSIWTPQHALMNTAPCISSPGIYQNHYMKPASGDMPDRTDTDEEMAIY